MNSVYCRCVFSHFFNWLSLKSATCFSEKMQFLGTKTPELKIKRLFCSPAPKHNNRCRDVDTKLSIHCAKYAFKNFPPFFTTPGRYFFVKESFEDPSLLTPRFPWRCRRERQKKKGDRKGDPPPSKPYKE